MSIQGLELPTNLGVLPNAGNVSNKAAEEHALQEYERFAERWWEYKDELGEGESIVALEAATKNATQRYRKLEGEGE